ncbi:DUF6414 family protein [Sideroxydans lithotrophicus]|uniref:Uncharacterized protein n=1 Tax=Sideroxydans lithotrophicus (strain ES-1) TaxID=580332 RepID=D5CQZ0_SIDLE|nr:hypothetical protein [Sideroxydans lithotrophicus]ADE11376.1 hypothetical protein Slit_1138 [Sideroxydans lithotrophicus ES-1]
MQLYDFIYVDLEKVISIYSQMTGGIVEALERSTENSRSADNKRSYDFKVLKHDAGGTTNDRSAVKEVIKPHHALLAETEEALATNGYLVDLTDPMVAKSFRDPEFRAQLKETFCIKVRGRAVFEDYERMKKIAADFPEVVKLINKSSESSLFSSPEYIQIKSKLDSAEKALKSIKDRNERSREEQRISDVRRELAKLVASATKVGMVDQWILDGVKTWIDAFLPGIVNFRVYPNPELPDEHVFGHLKKRCFEDAEFGALHFTYGSFPTENLTMIGVITSVPAEGGETFSPLAEFEKSDLADYETVENGFRGVFRGFDGMERMVRTSRFPRILVQPLTVYRGVRPNPSFRRAASGGR